MNKTLPIALASFALVLAACGSPGPSLHLTNLGGREVAPAPRGATATPAAAATAAPTFKGAYGAAGAAGPAGSVTQFVSPSSVPAPSISGAGFSGAADIVAAVVPTSQSMSALDTIGRQIISTATMSLEVTDVDIALNNVRAAAEGVGGSVERLASSTDKANGQASVTIRVPQPQFSEAIGRLEKLGKVTSRNLGSDDVTDQFIDLQARLKSSQNTEINLLKLEDKATSVSDVLTIESQLTRVRSDIERYQGQINTIERRVDLATITVNLSKPGVAQGQPPSANLVMTTKTVAASAGRVKDLVASLKGTIDFSNLTTVDGHDKASLTVRVFSSDFSAAMTSLDTFGKTTSREINEGTTGDANAAKPDKPDARIVIAFSEPPPAPSHVKAIALGVGAAILLLLLLAGGWRYFRMQRMKLVPA